MHKTTRTSEDSSSSSQPTTHTHTSKLKKHSILRKLSISSRRSIPWLNNEKPTNEPQNQQQQSNKVKFFSTTTPPNNNNTHDHIIPKGIRNVARTVRKSLHSFDRPRNLTADQPANQKNQHQHTIRNRALSTSEVYNKQPNKTQQEDAFRSLNHRSTPQDPPNNPTENSSSHALDRQQSSTPAPPRSPKRLQKKKHRPQSASEPWGSSAASAREPPDHATRFSWHAQPNIASLPQVATILAEPSPPPVDHSTFLAIIPGQPTPLSSVVPALSVLPPPASLQVEPPQPTAMSTRVEPALSRRHSLTSANNDPSTAGNPNYNSTDDDDDNNNNNNNGFTFIRSPPKLDPPPSPPTHDLGASWTHVTDHQSLQIHHSRPPLQSTTTTTSLVQSCIAERGSFSDLDQVEELTLDQKTPESPAQGEMPRKRKVTSLSDEASRSKAEETAEAEGVEERQHKVARAEDQPFSSSSSPPSPVQQQHPSEHHARALNHTTSHPLSVVVAGLSLRPRKASSCSTSTKKSRKSSLRKPAHHQHQHKPHSPASAAASSDIWNFSVVSTVVGVVFIAVVLIGSSHFSGFNGGKSWIGNWMKKVG